MMSLMHLWKRTEKRTICCSIRFYDMSQAQVKVTISTCSPPAKPQKA
jgi:hypothetical protein